MSGRKSVPFEVRIRRRRARRTAALHALLAFAVFVAFLVTNVYSLGGTP